jgi:hypothetical protein
VDHVGHGLDAYRGYVLDHEGVEALGEHVVVVAVEPAPRAAGRLGRHVD